MDLRLAQADTLIYLDIPTYKCLYRVISRTIKYYGQERADMPPGCKERFDLGFLHYVAVFNLIRKKKLLRKLSILKEEKRVFILRNQKEIESFIKKRG
jgi:adenylate kinase family enzyme